MKPRIAGWHRVADMLPDESVPLLLYYKDAPGDTLTFGEFSTFAGDCIWHFQKWTMWHDDEGWLGNTLSERPDAPTMWSYIPPLVPVSDNDLVKDILSELNMLKELLVVQKKRQDHLAEYSDAIKRENCILHRQIQEQYAKKYEWPDFKTKA